MRLLALLLLTLLCTCVRAQNMRLDTVEGPLPGYTTVRYITKMPAGSEMSKADRFMRGLGGDDESGTWDRLDSLIIFDEDGLRVPASIAPYPREPIADDLPHFDERVTHLEGRIGAFMTTSLRVNNPGEEAIVLKRTDEDLVVHTDRSHLPVPSHGSAELAVEASLPAGCVTHVVRMADGENVILELRIVLNGYDLNEQDFTKNSDEAPVWEVPAGRETLYLRLRSTEKLMTIYKDGRIYSKVAVGRQLDELNLSGLGEGEYRLEVIDLATGQRRYHGLRRAQ